jgi:hypothetical protein
MSGKGGTGDEAQAKEGRGMEEENAPERSFQME